MIKSVSNNVLSLLGELDVDLDRVDRIAEIEIDTFDQWVNRAGSAVRPTSGSCVMS